MGSKLPLQGVVQLEFMVRDPLDNRKGFIGLCIRVDQGVVNPIQLQPVGVEDGQDPLAGFKVPYQTGALPRPHRREAGEIGVWPRQCEKRDGGAVVRSGDEVEIQGGQILVQVFIAHRTGTGFVPRGLHGKGEVGAATVDKDEVSPLLHMAYPLSIPEQGHIRPRHQHSAGGIQQAHRQVQGMT